MNFNHTIRVCLVGREQVLLRSETAERIDDSLHRMAFLRVHEFGMILNAHETERIYLVLVWCADARQMAREAVQCALRESPQVLQRLHSSAGECGPASVGAPVLPGSQRPEHTARDVRGDGVHSGSRMCCLQNCQLQLQGSYEYSTVSSYAVSLHDLVLSVRITLYSEKQITVTYT